MDERVQIVCCKKAHRPASHASAHTYGHRHKTLCVAVDLHAYIHIHMDTDISSVDPGMSCSEHAGLMSVGFELSRPVGGF